MRKIIILLALVLSIWACYQTVVVGFNIGTNFTVSNYKDVEEASIQVDTLISQLINLNEVEYKQKTEQLESAIETYEDKKSEYEELQAMVEQTTSEPDLSLVDIYDVDFLWTIIGNYGTEEGISLKFDVTKSFSSTITSPDYTMCDLKFTISGDYIAITDFIYDIEDDSRLGFEISNFAMAKGGENLQATFTVKDVPINNANLTEITSSIDTSTVVNNGNMNTSTDTTLEEPTDEGLTTGNTAAE